MSSVPLMKISSKIGTIFKELSFFLAFDLWLNYYRVGEKIMNMFNYETWWKYFYQSSGLDFEVYFHSEWSPGWGTSEFVFRGSLIDYCISVLDCNHDIKIWNTYQQLMKNTGVILPFEKTCIVCDRPTHLCLDKEERLHAEGKPAIQFRDGFSIYSHHGLKLPEK